MSTNVIVHIGDPHLQHGHPRNADRLQALDQIVREILCLPILSAVLIPGDLCHTRSTAEDRNAWASRLQTLANRAPVILLRGNHDAPGDLDIYARLKATWPVYVVTRPQVLQVPLPTGDTAAIACLPYPDKSTLVSQAVAPGETSAAAVDIFDVMFMGFAHELEVLTADGAIPLFAGHVNVRGSISSSGQPQIGTELEIDRASLARLPVMYAALSHIHRAQEVGKGVYAGSIARLDYGEIEDKSYNVVTCRGDYGAWTATYERRPIDVAPMHHIEGRLTRDGFVTDDVTVLSCESCHGVGTDCLLCSGSGHRSWSGADVRVRYRYKASERAALNPKVIDEPFASASRLKVEGLAEPDRDLRAPEVAAAKTLPAKLAAYQKVDELTPSIANKLAWLEQDDPAHLQLLVAADLKAIESPAPAETATVAA